MSIFQIGATLFAIFMLYWVRNNQKRGFLNTLEASFWYSVWSLFIVISLFPQLLLGIVQILHFSRVFDLLTVLAFIILTILLFSVYLKNKKLEQKIEEIVRKIALEKE